MTALRVGSLFAGIGGFDLRRLTPRECERLQGFLDDWTLVPRPLTARQTRVRWMSDNARYRMLGNAVCVPVAEWIGRRIVALEEAA